ncbi:MAG: IS1380 family transposase [Chloroflexota bacterium]
MSRKRSMLGIEYAGCLQEKSTAFGGVGLLVELYRQAGVSATAEQVLPKKRSPQGLRQWEMVESFMLLSALGGECVDDMARLREDEGLGTLLGYTPPAPATARQWLDRFHEEEVTRGRPEQGAFIPLESAGLAGLREVNGRVVHAYVEAVKPGQEVTLDVDAHLVETCKSNAQYCYEGYKAYQPMVVCWAETGLVLGEEFRDGNVPASKDIRRLVDEAYEALPPGEWKVRVRSDSAAYEPEGILDHWHGKRGEFAVSADMSPQLRAAIEALPKDAWHAWKTEAKGAIREWADVPYVPSRKHERKDAPVYRYLAIRVRRQQGELWEDSSSLRHFAVVTNRWEMEGQALLEWQRGKAGTIEHAHHILTNELGAGVYPSAKHGANAAWLRLQVLTHNLLQLLKAVALPPEYAKARPKRLRFAIFTHIGQVVCHAGMVVMRITTRSLLDFVCPSQGRILEAQWGAG